MSNEKIINNLKSIMDEAYKNKQQDPDAWDRACHNFYTRYDQLAFPGGLERAFELLKKSDPKTIDLAIEYLRQDPYYFRSGYIKEKLAHLLKKASITAKQKVNIQNFLLGLLDQKQRYFKAYCRLAICVQDDNFINSLEQIVKEDPQKSQIAEKMLNLCKQNRRKDI